MAAAFPSFESGSVEISDVVRCILCKEDDATSPLIQLNCFHVCHRNCLKKSLKNLRPGSKFNCRECKFMNLLPANGIEGFPEELLHYKMKEALTSKIAPCPIHPNEVLKFYCQDCKVPLCQVCNGTKHKLHESISMQDAAQKFKEKFSDKVKDILPLKNDCEIVVNKLEKILYNIEQTSKQQMDECKKWGEDIKLAVDKIVGNNVLQISTEMMAQKDKIQKVTEETNDQNKQFQSAKNYIETVIKYASESDVLQMCNDLEANLDNILKQSTKVQITVNKTKIDMKNVKEIEKDLEGMMKVETEKKTYKIPGPQLRGFELEAEWGTDDWKSGVCFDDDEVIAVKDKKIEVYGIIGENKGKIKCQGLENAWDVELMNKQLVVSDINKKEILVLDRKGNIVRKISLPVQEYRKGSRWALGLAVDKSKDDIYISPNLSNTVYKCVKGQTKAHPFITTGLCDPCHLCVTSTSEVIVSNNSSHSVCKYNSEGALVWEYGRQGSGDGRLSCPRGVCVDFIDHIFVCDLNNHRIHHLSPDGKFLSYINIGEVIEYPWAIAFSRKRIIITSQSPSKITVIKCLYK